MRSNPHPAYEWPVYAIGGDGYRQLSGPTVWSRPHPQNYRRRARMGVCRYCATYVNEGDGHTCKFAWFCTQCGHGSPTYWTGYTGLELRCASCQVDVPIDQWLHQIHVQQSATEACRKQ
jgi:hypothetical protein